MPWYGLFIERQMEGATKSDFLTGAFNCSLHTATYTPNNDTDDFWNDATNEVTGHELHDQGRRPRIQDLGLRHGYGRVALRRRRRGLDDGHHRLDPLRGRLRGHCRRFDH